MYTNFRQGGGSLRGEYGTNTSGALKLQDIDGHIKENQYRHHTDLFGVQAVKNNTIVVRRAQSFLVEVFTNRKYDPRTDLLEIDLEFGENPERDNQTLIRLPLVKKFDGPQWSGILREINNNGVVVEIMSSNSAIVGEWTLKATARYPADPADKPVSESIEVIMLFNPWSKSDEVYVEDQADIEEYVLNEKGVIFKGSYDDMKKHPWQFDQFSWENLDAVLTLLEKSRTVPSAMRSPIIVSRTISQMVNANDNDNGVLWSNTSGDYSGGTPPYNWHSSTNIFRAWKQNNYAGVKWGQSIAFAGLATTVCRTLGMAARPATNYMSAHDTDGSLTIDYHFDAKSYRYLPGASNDSVWFYHSWTEVYMNRADLPSNFSGYQVIDGTPMESSGAAMQCGPASVAAVKEGMILQDFDTRFVFTEVNGDTVYWLKEGDSREFFSFRSDRIGKNIVTKARGSDEINDITNTYKHPEKELSERLTYYKTLKYSKARDLARIGRDLSDVKTELQVITRGNGEVAVKFNAKNEGQRKATINFSVTARHSNDSGVDKGEIKYEKADIIVDKGKEYEWGWTIEPEEWLPIVTGDGRLRIFLEGMVEETGQKFACQEFSVMDKEDLDVKLLTPNPKTKNPVKVQGKFKNPTSLKLTECYFTCEGPGIEGVLVEKVDDCPGGGNLTHEFTVIPRIPGEKEFILGFDSKEVTGYIGILGVKIGKGKAPESEDDESDEEEPEEPAKKPLLKMVKKDILEFLNTSAHHTDKYDHNIEYKDDDVIVLRRGQEYSVTVEYDREFDSKNDEVSLFMQAGPHPRMTDDTDQRLRRVKNLKNKTWCYKREKLSSTKWKYTIMTAPDAAVAIWKLKLRTKLKKGVRGTPDRETKKLASVYLLFNAWNEDDQVYMEGEAERKEYVLNHMGWVFRDDRYNPRRKWVFGQFTTVALETAMKLLEVNRTSYTSRGNAGRICRDMSQMCNSNDNDFGILVGNWSGNYDDGERPTSWNSSVDIFQNWWDNNFSGVKYGQCWVFSAILTSTCRALGIPTRSVTNFGSAHDTDGSCTIDKHFDEDDKPIKGHPRNDSVWNFHVWNEGWMRRPELPELYNGWQAFDSTPQEYSGGRMRCGPAPLVAIKEGNVGVKYDTMFIFSEINADRIYWKVTGNTREIWKCIPDSVGTQLATKAVGVFRREDVKGNYKAKEGSDAERRQVFNAATNFSGVDAVVDYYKNETKIKNQIEFKTEYKAPESAKVTVSATFENTAGEKRTVKYFFSACAAYYNGQTGDAIKEKTEKTTLDPGQNEVETFEVEPEEWLTVVKSDGMMVVHCGYRVEETDERDFEVIDVHLDKRELDVEVSNRSPKYGEEITVTVSFQNPLNMDLTKPSITVSGDGINDRTRKLAYNIKRNGSMTEKFKVLMKSRDKTVEVGAVLNSDQLTDIEGTTEITPVE